MMAKKNGRKTQRAKKKIVGPPNHDRFYFGKAGHLFVMSELLLQKWNVAMPEVDIGDDIFVVRDKDGFFMKVQVKSANVSTKDGVTSATVTTSYKQLTGSGDGRLIYFFIIRKNDTWDKVLIIERNELWALYQKVTPSSKKTGRKFPQTISIKLTYNGNSIEWKKENLDPNHNKWSYFDHNAPKITT